MTTPTKAELRHQIRTERRSHTAAELAAMSADVCQRLLAHPLLAAARTIMAYAPLPDEVDVWPAIEAWREAGKTVLLPRVVSETEMTVCRYDGPQSLREGAFHIMEPAEVCAEPSPTDQRGDWGRRHCLLRKERDSCLRNDNATTVIIVPGMAFDRNGRRLGRGRGYYDRFLAPLSAHTIGVCFPFQLVTAVPSEPHDRTVCEVISI